MARPLWALTLLFLIAILICSGAGARADVSEVQNASTSILSVTTKAAAKSKASKAKTTATTTTVAPTTDNVTSAEAADSNAKGIATDENEKAEAIPMVTTEEAKEEVKLQVLERGQSVKQFAKARLASGLTSAPRSLLQVCRREISKACQAAGFKQGVEVAKNATTRINTSTGTSNNQRTINPNDRVSSIVKCLEDKIDEIEDEQCREWINARQSCSIAARKHANCNASIDSDRVCLRKVPAEDLPEACTSSAYYKSVKMFGTLFRDRKSGERIDANGRGSAPRRVRPTQIEKSFNDRTRKPRNTRQPSDKP